MTTGTSIRRSEQFFLWCKEPGKRLSARSIRIQRPGLASERLVGPDTRRFTLWPRRQSAHSSWTREDQILQILGATQRVLVQVLLCFAGTAGGAHLGHSATRLGIAQRVDSTVTPPPHTSSVTGRKTGEHLELGR